ncbi:hypothetical protein [Falsirhodobacter sp. 20TX0035]|uniref:hypothetical protein n=1 Tax=Falsirhodobacter sp. 20TX0035 TaxID=3022019 RepID=UPI0023309EE8|nr:hypothetical protein [Falsirhodobacter sp. 20TX0035]MDB6454998.1 hypothetical protein [Falsirhodobacter sp. 20TX0035]
MQDQHLHVPAPCFKYAAAHHTFDNAESVATSMSGLEIAPPKPEQRTTTMSDLRKLIEMVEADYFEVQVMEKAIPLRQWGNFIAAYHGSLDAARALHDALVPGWTFDITNGSAFVCDVAKATPQYSGQCRVHAAAWLIAILKAYEARQ